MNKDFILWKFATIISIVDVKFIDQRGIKTDD